MKDITSLSAEELHRAGAIKEQIQRLERELQSIFGVSSGVGISKPAKRGGMSAAARAKISAAAKARWAKQKGETAVAKPIKKKRTMSAAAKKKISDSAKARWKKAKAAG